MNIKILDSWLREYLKTKAQPNEIAENLSLSSVSVERVEKVGNDFIYDIEVTTNRPDLMSVIGIAREASAVLTDAEFKELKPSPKIISQDSQKLEIENDPKLVNRICAIIMEVKIGESPKHIKDRLESSDIRSLNNLIDITNYVMRETGHPAHVFDYDRLKTKKLIIRESKNGEKIKTLDGKIHTLSGADIVADNGNGEIEDLLGVMGTENSVVTNDTKRIVYFLDNNEPNHIRKTSMELGIRTEAAVVNEKGVDPELTSKAFLRGIELYQLLAGAKILSEPIDIYPNRPKVKEIKISNEKINKIIGIQIPLETSLEILSKLGFETKAQDGLLTVKIPSTRANDIQIEEDIVEEIARIYGYHKLPNLLPPQEKVIPHSITSTFYWEKRVKEAFRYWGFTEVYTYSMVSEELLEGPHDQAVTIQNPLSEDRIYLRTTLIPSLLEVVRENPSREEIKIFEIANVYHKRGNDLPDEKLMLSGVLKSKNISFYDVKGIIEQLLKDQGVNASFKPKASGGLGAQIHIGNDFVGEIEVLDEEIADFEIDFEKLLKQATVKKTYNPISKFPCAIEDLRIVVSNETPYEKIVKTIKNASNLVADVSLLDVYQDKKTFRITYLDPEKNLTNEEITREREKIISNLKQSLKADLA